MIELLDAVKDFLEYKLRVVGIEDSVLLKMLKNVRDFINSYDIKDVNDGLKERLEVEARKNNLECNVEVYDVNDVLENLHGLREDVKSKYRELLLTINTIIETTW
jgi:hypothetical protein